MHRVRNAVIIIILCIIGSYTVRKAPQLSLNSPDNEIRDSVAGGPSRHRGGPKLTLASGSGDELRDAVAGHAVGTPNNGNTLDNVPPPPRGEGNGGIGPRGGAPGRNFIPQNPVSQDGPEETPPTQECSDCSY